jgi:hypothetical protein
MPWPAANVDTYVLQLHLLQQQQQLAYQQALAAAAATGGSPHKGEHQTDPAMMPGGLSNNVQNTWPAMHVNLGMTPPPINPVAAAAAAATLAGLPSRPSVESTPTKLGRPVNRPDLANLEQALAKLHGPRKTLVPVVPPLISAAAFSPPQTLTNPVIPQHPMVNHTKAESVEGAPSEASDIDTGECVKPKEGETEKGDSTKPPARKSRFSVTKVKDAYSEEFRMQQEKVPTAESDAENLESTPPAANPVKKGRFRVTLVDEVKSVGEKSPEVLEEAPLPDPVTAPAHDHPVDAVLLAPAEEDVSRKRVNSFTTRQRNKHASAPGEAQSQRAKRRSSVPAMHLSPPPRFLLNASLGDLDATGTAALMVRL